MRTLADTFPVIDVYTHTRALEPIVRRYIKICPLLSANPSTDVLCTGRGPPQNPRPIQCAPPGRCSRLAALAHAADPVMWPGRFGGNFNRVEPDYRTGAAVQPRHTICSRFAASASRLQPRLLPLMSDRTASRSLSGARRRVQGRATRYASSRGAPSHGRQRLGHGACLCGGPSPAPRSRASSKALPVPTRV
jgi:hypothetical protein